MPRHSILRLIHRQHGVCWFGKEYLLDVALDELWCRYLVSRQTVLKLEPTLAPIYPAADRERKREHESPETVDTARV